MMYLESIQLLWKRCDLKPSITAIGVALFLSLLVHGQTGRATQETNAIIKPQSENNSAMQSANTEHLSNEATVYFYSPHSGGAVYLNGDRLGDIGFFYLQAKVPAGKAVIYILDSLFPKVFTFPEIPNPECANLNLRGLSLGELSEKDQEQITLCVNSLRIAHALVMKSYKLTALDPTEDTIRICNLHPTPTVTSYILSGTYIGSSRVYNTYNRVDIDTCGGRLESAISGLTGSPRNMTIAIEAGKTYYIRLEEKSLKIVDAEIGAKEIRKLHPGPKSLGVSPNSDK